MIYQTLIWKTIILTLLPLIPSPHWSFRVPDFGKIQLFCIQIVLLGLSWLDFHPISFFPLLATSLLNGSLLLKYTPLYPTSRKPVGNHASKPFTILSLNVYQDNRNYQKFLDLVTQIKPDLILTSDTGWDQALESLHKDYPYHLKAPLDNNYGMHLFSRLPFLKSKIHFFVADD